MAILEAEEGVLREDQGMRAVFSSAPFTVVIAERSTLGAGGGEECCHMSAFRTPRGRLWFRHGEPRKATPEPTVNTHAFVRFWLYCCDVMQ